MRQLFGWVRKHRLLVLAATAALVVSAIVFALRAQQLEAQTLSPPLSRGAIIESVYGIGTVRAAHSFELKTGVGATIERLYIQEGDTVKRGQRLVQLSGVGTFTAPFDGTITFLPYKVGETVFAQAAILQLVDMRDRYLVVSIEQRGALRVRAGQEARLSVEGMREQSYRGTVEAVYSRGNEFLVRIDVSQLPPQVMPQMTADVAIGIATRKDVIVIPVNALHEGKVYVKRDGGKPRAVDVKLGIVDGEMAEVIAGDLRVGDRLVISEKPPS